MNNNGMMLLITTKTSIFLPFSYKILLSFLAAGD